MFVDPSAVGPIDFAARVAAIPAGTTARGMFFQFVLEAMGPDVAARLGPRRYVAFKHYPMREYVELLELGYREQPARVSAAQWVRRVGRCIYPNYANTMTGMAIFAVAGRDFRRVLELCPAAYRVAIEGGGVTVRSISDSHAVLELRGIWNLPEIHQVGVFEGAMEVCGVDGQISVAAHGYGAADLEIRWRPQGA